MFSSNKKTIPGFGKLRSVQKGAFLTKMNWWDRIYDVKLITDFSSDKVEFTKKQTQALEAFSGVEEKLQALIRQYYEDHFEEIYEQFYEQEYEDWDSSREVVEAFRKIRDRAARIDMLLQYFELQTLRFSVDGACELFAYLADSDEQGVVITVFPELGIKEVDELDF